MPACLPTRSSTGRYKSRDLPHHLNLRSIVPGTRARLFGPAALVNLHTLSIGPFTSTFPTSRRPLLESIVGFGLVWFGHASCRPWPSQSPTGPGCQTVSAVPGLRALPCRIVAQRLAGFCTSTPHSPHLDRNETGQHHHHLHRPPTFRLPSHPLNGDPASSHLMFVSSSSCLLPPQTTRCACMARLSVQAPPQVPSNSCLRCPDHH
ncbi:hypothetical protein B0T19DRAFT_128023 [Cercophora scortea]|uniref:Uncharacterized protein n=1 Tax=Cercophora scortea TaxID=314031 RepID=A0AAE0MI61_9PEZI|nr:hypothetical protein B0T19DRAFT_128023 [Cercophora scortea]